MIVIAVVNLLLSCADYSLGLTCYYGDWIVGYKEEAVPAVKKISCDNDICLSFYFEFTNYVELHNWMWVGCKSSESSFVDSLPHIKEHEEERCRRVGLLALGRSIKEKSIVTGDGMLCTCSQDLCNKGDFMDSEVNVTRRPLKRVNANTIGGTTYCTDCRNSNLIIFLIVVFCKLFGSMQ